MNGKTAKKLRKKAIQLDSKVRDVKAFYLKLDWKDKTTWKKDVK